MPYVRKENLSKFYSQRMWVWLEPRNRITVFPRNLAAATFNFVVQFGAATFRGRRLKYSLHYWASVRNVRYLESTSIYCVYMHALAIIMTPLYHMRREFEGGV